MLKKRCRILPAGGLGVSPQIKSPPRLGDIGGSLGIFQQSLRIEGGDKLASEVGKRYLCEKCNTEFIVTRAGEGKLACCGQPMTLKK